VREFPSVVTAISRIPEQAWIPIRYPNAIYDEDAGRWVSEAEVAEVPFTAFTGRPRRDRVTARLIVRRVRRLNPGHANAAWLACATIAHNLTRTAGALASTIHARARTGTIRAQLIHTTARIARSANRLVLHLPRDWPWEPGLDELFHRAVHDPLPTAA
jgi:hypothetical protein